jgi:prolipoprotein diacylglyceryl transferase
MIEWSVSPIAFFVGPVAIRWYSMGFAASFMIGNAIMEKIYRAEKKSEDGLFALLVHMILGTVIGARLGHVLFYDPGYYLSHLSEIPKVWQGGLASHGAAIAIPFSVWLYARKKPAEPFLWLLDRLAIITALAGFFIRMGNFFNSEILGMVSTVPWAVTFTRIDNLPRHPTQIYEALAYLATFIYLYRSYWQQKEKLPHGQHFGIFLIMIFGSRFILEFFKERQAAFEVGLPLDMGQILSVPLIALGAWLIWRARRNRPTAKYR